MTAKEKLLTHAVQLFAAKGIHQTSIRDIAQAAGVNAQLVYYYFGSKTDLIKEAVAQASQETAGILDEAEALETSVEAIRSIITHFMKASEARSVANRLIGHIIMTQDELALGYVHEAIDVNARRVQSLITKGVRAGEIRNDIDVELAATAIIGLPMWYAMSIPLSARVGVRYDTADSQVADILISGLKAS